MKNLRTFILIILVLLVVSLFVSCSSNTSKDKEAIEQALNGYVSSYNANHFEETVTYFTGYSDKQDAIDYLVFLKSVSGNLTIVNFDSDSIAITGNTAKSPVDFIIMGELSFQWVDFKKVDTGWKILWKQ